ncbi:MAG: 4Fe-4S dicluster domain-containing protein [Candidatus Omnitrophica bacterium]|nr:4Fe-4S dicluster domain-containing protein [Candidatus Omnitrophota bacterium]
MVEEIRSKAKELLKTKRVDIIIGYKRASDGVSATPAFVNTVEGADELIWDAYCTYNLSRYLNDFPGKKKGIVAKACDAKSIIVLLQENQLRREDIFVIGVECSGVIDEEKLRFGEGDADRIQFDQRCKGCDPSVYPICDLLIKDKGRAKTPGLEKDPYEAVRKFEVKSIQDRFNFWKEEFSRCIRCYACRGVCPSCYCPRCVADQTMPAWFSKATSFEGNFAWNVTRAIHLAGRCIDCGECERACPIGIPLRDINKKIEKDVKELFGYEAGLSDNGKPLFASFDKEDPEDFIR